MGFTSAGFFVRNIECFSYLTALVHWSENLMVI